MGREVWGSVSSLDTSRTGPSVSALAAFRFALGTEHLWSNVLIELAGVELRRMIYEQSLLDGAFPEQVRAPAVLLIEAR